MLTVGTAQQGRVQHTKACIINYILRPSFVPYDMIQSMNVCYNLHTKTHALATLHVKFKQTCIKNATLHLEPEGHTYMKCYITVFCINVLRNGHADQLLQIQ